MKQDKQFTVIDTTYIPDYEDEYVEYCEANGIEPDVDGSEDYWDYVGDRRNFEYRNGLENLKYSEDMGKPCIITGSLGLWDGKKAIWATRAKDIVSAIKKCYRGCDDIIVKFKNGVYECEAIHHDGSNCFEVRKLTASGIKATDKWYSDSNSIEVKPSWIGKFKGI